MMPPRMTAQQTTPRPVAVTRRPLLGTALAGASCAWLASLPEAADKPPSPEAVGKDKLDAEQKAHA